MADRDSCSHSEPLVDEAPDVVASSPPSSAAPCAPCAPSAPCAPCASDGDADVSCPHVRPDAHLVSPYWHLQQSQVLNCVDCNCNGPDLWICLQKDCLHIGCSENHNDHSTIHYKKNPLHCVHMNITNRHAWCYECCREVFPFTEFSIVSQLSNTFTNANQIGNNGGGGLKGARERLRTMTSIGLERGPGLNVSGTGDSQESTDAEDEDALDYNYNGKPRGLVGLQNIGNTCYMNSAIQALSNTPPLTQYFLDCNAFVDFLTESKKSGVAVSRSYQKLVREIWNKKTRGYVVPNTILYGIRNVHPMFRGYHQHDTQEFLRCFMDQLHEELKEPVRENKEIRKVQSETKFITKQPIQQNTLVNHTSSGSYQTILSKKKDVDCNVKDVKRRQRSPARSFDNIPSATSNIFYRVNTQIEDGEVSSSNVVNYGHRRSASYCDPCGYSQIPQDTIGESRSSSRPTSPLDFMDQESSEKELDDDDEDTYETCDSGASDTASINGDDNYSTTHPNIGFKRKHENEKRVSESETSSDTSSNAAKYRSVISDIFDGRLLSSVQCLTCDRISTRVETFKDLSLPIPSRDHMAVLHNNATSTSGTSGNSGASNGGRSTACSDAVYSATSSQEGWVWWLLSWLRSWFYGPTVTLHDCLAAFFSADELKGDNMYSCEKCNKLRNGVKFSKVLSLPEVLCVHLKRFRHELMSSTKIGAKVSFPLTGLDMRPYLHKDCTSTVSTYDLVAIICHTGTAGAGHYTCIARNRQVGRWFEFDDQYVTNFTPEQVAASEAYVLFYKKVNPRMMTIQQNAMDLLENVKESSDAKYYISKQWINRFKTHAEPGPIDNSDFLCAHGSITPDRIGIVDRLTFEIPQSLWDFLYQSFGGGPVCNQLRICAICQSEAEKLQKRQIAEFQQYLELHCRFSNELEQDVQTSLYAINMNWVKIWFLFARNKTQDIPPPIDNSGIVLKSRAQDGTSNRTPTVVSNCDYTQINEKLWRFFHGIYGGGPEIKLRSAPAAASSDHTKHPTFEQWYNNSNEQSNYNQTAPKSSDSTVNTYEASHRKESDSEGNFNVDVPQTKSLSNVDLLAMERRNDVNIHKTSVKTTQSLQDVSVRHHKNNHIHQNSVQNIHNNGKESENVMEMNGIDEVFNDQKPVMVNGKMDDDSGEVSLKAKDKKKGKSLKKSQQNNNKKNRDDQKTHNTTENAYNRNSNNTVVYNHVHEDSIDSETEKSEFQKCNTIKNNNYTNNDLHVSDIDCYMESHDTETVSKQKTEPGPGVHQNAKTSGGGKHKKSSNRKVKRQQQNNGNQKKSSVKYEESTPTPVMNGSERAAK